MTAFKTDALAMAADPLLQGNRPDDALLTTAEAAQRLRLSPRTLERLRVSGIGPRYLKAGPGKRARVFYLASDLALWIGQFRFASTSEYGRAE